MKNKQTNVFIILIAINVIVVAITLTNIQVFKTQLSILAWAYFVLLLLGIMFYYHLQDINKKKIEQTTFKIHELKEDLYKEIDMGLILYDESKYITWCNKFISKNFGININVKIDKLGDSFLNNFKTQEKSFRFEYNFEYYDAKIDGLQKVIFIEKVSKIVNLEKLLEFEVLEKKKQNTIFMFVAVDNYDDIIQKIDERKRNEIDNTIRNLLEEWAANFKAYAKRYQANRFVLVVNQKNYEEMVVDKFSILNQIRNSFEFKVPLSISIGIGKDERYVLENVSKAMHALELAQNRGGDQIVIKGIETEYLGGVKEAHEKSNKILVRQISNNIEKAINSASNIVITGHSNFDFDSFGASLLFLKIAKSFSKDVYIARDPKVEKSVQKVLIDAEMKKYFHDEEKINEIINEKTLLVIVDISIPSLIVFPKLLNKIKNRIVIDHHRQKENSIDAEIMYIEPYASSTCELVIEMLEFVSSDVDISKISTYVLAGMTVDTKNFTFRTGIRTFEAAAVLKKNGADSLEVQSLLKENIEDFLISANSIKNTEVFLENIGIVVIKEVLDTTELAKIADKLLEFDKIEASFVIGHIDDTTIKISSRSLGDINVQKIMEQLGGGGHLTNAAVQIENSNINEIISKLKEIILLERI